jgi:hypothetical protein
MVSYGYRINRQALIESCNLMHVSLVLFGARPCDPDTLLYIQCEIHDREPRGLYPCPHMVANQIQSMQRLMGEAAEG